MYTAPALKRYSHFVLISFLIGVANEFVAWLTSIWIYHPKSMTFVNLILMFLIIMPLLALGMARRPLWQVFIAGFAVGLIYEFLDQYYLHWASFPHNQFLFLTNLLVIRIVIAGLWGLVPVVMVGIEKWWWGAEDRSLPRA